MKFCPNCGTKNEVEGASFCPECGFHFDDVKMDAAPTQINPAPPMPEATQTPNVNPFTGQVSVKPNKRIDKKWLIPGIAAAVVIVLVAVFALTMGGGLNKNDAIRFEVNDLTCYVPSDWECYGDGWDYAYYGMELGDDYVEVDFDYLGYFSLEDYEDARIAMESDEENEVKNFTVSGADDSFLVIYRDDEYVEYLYIIRWGESVYTIYFEASTRFEDEKLFKDIVKSVEYNG